MFVTNLLLGLVLGGAYALVALGLTLQYGVARIMNLAYGEFVIAAAFGAFVGFTALGLSPLLAIFIIAPAAFVLSGAIYRLMLLPLVKRAKHRGALEIDSILSTFGLLFVIQGVLLVMFGGDFVSYSYLAKPVHVLSATLAANRLIALALALAIGGGMYLLITRTRWGARLRAVAYAPEAAPLVGVDVQRVAMLGFALGGGIAAIGGVAVSMFQGFTAASGVVFTMKALIVVIMGGVGDMLGALMAGLFLGVVETMVSAYIDPGLTLAAAYLIFLVSLLWRPQGLFGKATARP